MFCATKWKILLALTFGAHDVRPTSFQGDSCLQTFVYDPCIWQCFEREVFHTVFFSHGFHIMKFCFSRVYGTHGSELTMFHQQMRSRIIIRATCISKLLSLHYFVPELDHFADDLIFELKSNQLFAYAMGACGVLSHTPLLDRALKNRRLWECLIFERLSVISKEPVSQV